MSMTASTTTGQAASKLPEVGGFCPFDSAHPESTLVVPSLIIGSTSDVSVQSPTLSRNTANSEIDYAFGTLDSLLHANVEFWCGTTNLAKR